MCKKRRATWAPGLPAASCLLIQDTVGESTEICACSHTPLLTKKGRSLCHLVGLTALLPDLAAGPDLPENSTGPRELLTALTSSHAEGMASC